MFPISLTAMDVMNQEVYGDIDNLTSAIFVVNFHRASMHYTMTLQHLPEEAPYQYAFRDTDKQTVEFFTQFRLDIVALGFIQGMTIENEYGNRKQVTFTRG